MSSCYCDYDSPEFYAAATRTARRAHQCEECRGSITLGDRYENVSGIACRIQKSMETAYEAYGELNVQRFEESRATTDALLNATIAGCIIGTKQ